MCLEGGIQMNSHEESCIHKKSKTYRNRNISVQVYLTEAEKNILDNKCKNANMDVSKFIRHLILEKDLINLQPEEISNISLCLQKYAKQIEMIGRKYNEDDFYYNTSDFEELKRMILDMQSIVFQNITSMIDKYM